MNRSFRVTATTFRHSGGEDRASFSRTRVEKYWSRFTS